MGARAVFCGLVKDGNTVPNFLVVHSLGLLQTTLIAFLTLPFRVQRSAHISSLLEVSSRSTQPDNHTLEELDHGYLYSLADWGWRVTD